ncbi:PHD finger protein ALFIN-LIKE 4-like [Nymphaea colorata]|nr:PHD finger protein ALFIN-LIKE 4-like [Nymphaea colorata]
MDGPSRSVEDVFKDYKSRRAGLIKALTTDVREFYRQCDPEKENLCLYGYPNESWEVNLPSEEVPPELPEPVLGINFSRDGMLEEDWLKLVAVHSDSWLIALAFYFGLRFGFDKNDRRRLFNMINGLPSIYEVVSGKKEAQEVSSVTNNGNSKNKRENITRATREQVSQDDVDEEEEGDDVDEHKDALCGACGMNNTSDQFWICCDICERWFHGKCVKITPAKAQHIKQYKCPGCSNKKARAQF